jgi:hypothetical protein
MASAARWRQKKKHIQKYPAQKAQSQTGRGGWRSVEAVGGAHPVILWHDQTDARRAWGRATGRVAHPPRHTQYSWSVEVAVLWRCRACGDGSPSPVATSPQTRRFCAPPASSTGFIPTPAAPSPTGCFTGRFCGYIGTPSPPPTPPTHRGHQKSTPCAPIWTPNAQICPVFPRSTTHTDPASRGGAAPCFRCEYAVIDGGVSRAILDTIDTLDMVVRERTERTRQRERDSPTFHLHSPPYRPCSLSSFSFERCRKCPLCPSSSPGRGDVQRF